MLIPPHLAGDDFRALRPPTPTRSSKTPPPGGLAGAPHRPGTRSKATPGRGNKINDWVFSARLLTGLLNIRCAIFITWPHKSWVREPDPGGVTSELVSKITAFWDLYVGTLIVKAGLTVSHTLTSPTFWGQQNVYIRRRRLPRRSAGHGRVAGRGGSTRAGLNLASRDT